MDKFAFSTVFNYGYEGRRPISHPAFRKSKPFQKQPTKKLTTNLVIVLPFPTAQHVPQNLMSVEEIIEKFKVIRHRATQALPERLDEESELEESATKLWDDVKDVRDLAKEIMNLVQPDNFEILDL